MIQIASFIISALMGMGVGGGGLFVIYLTLCMNLPQLRAQGTNLFLFLLAGSSSLIYHLRHRKISPWQVLFAVFFGSLGAVTFSRLAQNIDPKYPRILLGILLTLSGAFTIYNALIKPFLKKFKKTLYK